MAATATLAVAQPFWTDSPQATAYNNGRNIALDPTTGWLHLVYEAFGSIRYCYSTDKGATWSGVEVVSPDLSNDPCIVCEDQPNGLVWVSYVYNPQTQPVTQILSSVRLNTGQWVTYTVCQANAWAAPGPAMSVCHDMLGPNDFPGVYVVHGEGYVDDVHWYNRIVFDRVVLGQGVVTADHAVLFQTVDPDYCMSPSVATTPGDWVNVAWMWYLGSYDNSRVMYRQRDHGTWHDLEQVSDPNVSGTEPAWWPSAEAFGDSVHVVWRGYSEEQAVPDVWKRARNPAPFQPPEWSSLVNRSQTPSSPSLYPEQSTHWATIWQEGQAGVEDICASLFGNVVTIYADDLSSNFPSLAAEWPGPGGSNDVFWVYAAWTNATAPGQPWPYQVMCEPYSYIPPSTGFHDFVYYDCGVGESIASAYCLARDGYARWNGHSVDFAVTQLKYRLPYLNPHYDYKLRAVLYQASKDTWEQSFSADTIPLARVRFRPNVPETILVTIPRHLYAKKCRVDFGVHRLLGKYAAVADLKLYECFPYREGKGEAGTETAPPPPAVALRLTGPRPSVLRKTTSFTYAVSSAAHVQVRVFDSQGRQVRLLSSAQVGPGARTLRWDGRDDRGVPVPAGAYTVQARCGSSVQSAKVVVQR
jgi:hypothetical protein